MGKACTARKYKGKVLPSFNCFYACFIVIVCHVSSFVWVRSVYNAHVGNFAVKKVSLLVCFYKKKFLNTKHENLQHDYFAIYKKCSSVSITFSQSRWWWAYLIFKNLSS